MNYYDQYMQKRSDVERLKEKIATLKYSDLLMRCLKDVFASSIDNIYTIRHLLMFPYFKMLDDLYVDDESYEKLIKAILDSLYAALRDEQHPLHYVFGIDPGYRYTIWRFVVDDARKQYNEAKDE